MKRLLVLVATAALAVGIYAAAAPGSQEVVTPKQFAALKKQVTKLRKDVNTIREATVALFVCDFRQALPMTVSPTLHVTSPSEQPDFYAVATNKECADAMNSPPARARRLLKR